MVNKTELKKQIEEMAMVDMGMDEVAIIINEVNEILGWNGKKTQPEWAALAHSEITEAFEEFRDHGPEAMYYEEEDKRGQLKPEGMAIEYADALIRILHWFIQHDISPSEMIRTKLLYNITRPYRHGGKVV